MASYKCPGQDMRFWKPDDVFTVECPNCGTDIEFWKDDPDRVCGNCNINVRNPAINPGCAKWCSYAEECLGKDILDSVKKSIPVRDLIISAMKNEFGNDTRRAGHALRVLDYAEKIQKKNKTGSNLIVIAAAVLHDIRILNAEQKFDTPDVTVHEEEGIAVARRILEEISLDRAVIEHVCRIVGSHHSGGDIDTIEFKIVYDADLIVNLHEKDKLSEDKVTKEYLEKIFKTEEGIKIAEKLFLKD